jgi:hypothetical protein
MNSRNIKLKDNKTYNKNSLYGRFAAVEVEIEGVTTWLTSIYLDANAAERGLNINDLHSEPDLIHKNSIIGGDFNCVAVTNLDTKTPSGTGSSSYGNAHSISWEALTAHYGLADIYRLHHGAKAAGFTRYHHNGSIATRMDRLYGPRYNSPWRWTFIDASHNTTTPAPITSPYSLRSRQLAPARAQLMN